MAIGAQEKKTAAFCLPSPRKRPTGRMPSIRSARRYRWTAGPGQGAPSGQSTGGPRSRHRARAGRAAVTGLSPRPEGVHVSNPQARCRPSASRTVRRDGPVTLRRVGAECPARSPPPAAPRTARARWMPEARLFAIGDVGVPGGPSRSHGPEGARTAAPAARTAAPRPRTSSTARPHGLDHEARSHRRGCREPGRRASPGVAAVMQRRPPAASQPDPRSRGSRSPWRIPPDPAAEEASGGARADPVGARGGPAGAPCTCAPCSAWVTGAHRRPDGGSRSGVLAVYK